MIRYILKRLLNYVVLLFVAVSLAYCLASTALHPRSLFLMRQPPVAHEVIEKTLNDYNINDATPLWDRYFTWLTNIFTKWDWGYSPLGVSVNDEIGIRMWVSLRLLLVGTILGLSLGVALGAWTATKQYKLSDRTATALALLIIATPSYVLGPVLQILAIGYNRMTGTDTFKVVGEGGVDGNILLDLLSRAEHLLLPTVVLMLMTMASMSRIQRNLMLDSLGADYVRTARAKGLTRRKAVMKHALRTALIPTGTYVAFTVATMFVGATFTERIFNFRGMGMYGVDAILQQNINGVAAVTAFAGVCTLTGAILADIFVAILDPRVRLQ